MTTVAEFEAGTVDSTAFRHTDHVRVIWSLIHAYGMLEAIARFESGLKRITAEAGHPEKYHATITYAFAFVVGERIAEQGPLSWADFVDVNSDLLEWPNRTLQCMYADDVLGTSTAKQAFIMPRGRV